VRAEATRWLWDGRIPLGAATLLVGREKLGTSTLTCELAACLSRGELDSSLAGELVDTLLVSYEDHAARTIKPRLMAAGARPGRVHRPLVSDSGVPDLVSLPGDVQEIARLARELNVRLVVVDPLSAALDGSVDSHRDQDIRRAIAPLAQLAEELDIAILCTAHWNKSQGGDSFSRVLGSRGLTAAVRSVLAFGRPPDADDGSTERVLAHTACNVGPEASSLSCRVEGRLIEEDGDATETAKLMILGETDTGADDLLVTRTEEERSERDDAADFLRGELADGPRLAAEITAGRAAGISTATLRRATQQAGVESHRPGGSGPWRWSFPPPNLGAHPPVSI
jgi:AAA domain